MEKNFELMFDSDGSLTMSLLHGENRVFVQFYDDMEQAAGDLKDFLTLEYSVELWDGNMLKEDDFDPGYLEFNAMVERNGGAFWTTTIEEIKESAQIFSWKNLQDFIKAWEA